VRAGDLRRGAPEEGEGAVRQKEGDGGPHRRGQHLLRRKVSSSSSPPSSSSSSSSFFTYFSFYYSSCCYWCFIDFLFYFSYFIFRTI
jgi:hypothetical protein